MLALSYQSLADLNAVLNATALVLICLALAAIKRGDVRRHKQLMLTAVGVSAAFLTSYLIYHYQVGSARFGHEGVLRTFYLVLLVSHIVLAVVQVPLIAATVWLGLKDRRATHRRLAKVIAPIWLYVSSTGVIVYIMLYWL